MAVDRVGHQYGHWTVVGVEEPKRTGKASFHRMWRCQCVCGAIRTVNAGNLASGSSASCGCVKQPDKVCSICKIKKPNNEFYRRKSGIITPECRACNSVKCAERYARKPQPIRDIQRRNRIKLREQTFAALGRFCQCCGEDRIIFLALDHVNGGGSKEVKGPGGASGVYRKARDLGFPKALYQILCHNCNWAKHHTGGNCPHKQPSWMPPTYGGFSCIGG